MLVAAAGKSALVPFSGWLPRAMEGPTPSSAVFYGALSVHLGAFLLLRVSPLLDASPLLSALVAIVGLTTAVFAYLAGSVQTDIKSALSFASLSQVGIIVAEIGLGFRYIALIHILGHACLRTLQFVRAPTLLHDYHTMENAIGEHLPRGATAWPGSTHRFKDWLYRFALERGYLDAILRDFVAAPFMRLFRWFDSIEQRWTDFLAGRAVARVRGAEAPLRDDRGALMRFLELPWIEFSIATTLIGSLWISQIREPNRAARMGLFFTGLAFAFTFLAWLEFYLGIAPESVSRSSLEPYLFGREVLASTS